MTRRLYNNSVGTLGAALTNSGQTITFASAPAFATVTAPDFIPLILEPASSSQSQNFEIVHLTAYTSGQTTGTIARGQESTAAVSHSNGAAWCCGPTVGDAFSLLAGVSVTAPPYVADPTGATTDTSAIQDAINDTVTKGGGVVYLPPGVYKKNYHLELKLGVELRGSGRGCTFIVDTTDLGSGVASISTDEDTNAIRYPAIRDLTLVGPAAGATTSGFAALSPGTSPANMDGIAANSDAQIFGCNVWGYRSGISILGNHQHFEDVRCCGCYYGVYFAGGGSSFDNQYFYKCEIALNNWASIGIHGDNRIGASHLLDVHLGFGPYGIYKENNGVDSSKQVIVDSVLDTVWFESVGNGAVYDATGARGVINNTWTNLYVLWTGSRKIIANAADYTFVAGAFNDNTFTSVADIGLPPGAVGVFNTGQAYNNKFLAGGGSLIANMTGGALIFADGNDVQGTDIATRQGGRCTMRKVVGSTNPSLGSLVYLAGQSSLQSVAVDAVSSSSIPVGTVQAWGQSGTGHWAPILVQGRGPQLAKTASNLGSNIVAAADTAGTRGNVIAGSYPGTATSPIVGYGNGTSSSAADLFITLGS